MDPDSGLSVLQRLHLPFTLCVASLPGYAQAMGDPDSCASQTTRHTPGLGLPGLDLSDPII